MIYKDYNELISRIIERPILLSDFNIPEDWLNIQIFEDDLSDIGWALNDIITECNELRRKYIETKEMKYIYAISVLLPQSFI